jgi:hypothetical protein
MNNLTKAIVDDTIVIPIWKERNKYSLNFPAFIEELGELREMVDDLVAEVYPMSTEVRLLLAGP